MPELLSFVILASNGLKDRQLATFLDVFMEQTELKQLVIKLNDFGEDSLDSLANLLNRQVPIQLQELRLVSVKTSPLITTKLCEMLT